MTIASFMHGYPPLWSMGGEVSTHRTLRTLPDVTVFTHTDQPYDLDGVKVLPLDGDRYLSVVNQAEEVGASCLFAHSTLSRVTVQAARKLRIPSILAVHAPVRYANDLRKAWPKATVRLYNTEAARSEWRDSRGWVLHPPTGRPDREVKGPRDALTLTSSLLNKGVNHVLKLAVRWPHRRFIIVESPAHATHGDPLFWETVSELPNVEIWPRMHPDLMGDLWSQTRVLLVPSRYETYGLSAIEAAHHGIPSVHVDTIHVREGIGEAARLLRSSTVEELALAVEEIEADYNAWSDKVSTRADYLYLRELHELEHVAAQVASLTDESTSVG